MFLRRRPIAVLFASLCLLLIGVEAQTPHTSKTAEDGKTVSMHATGPFEVAVVPQDDKLDPSLGRLTFDKHFHGDLEATSKGQMLSVSTGVKGSAGYVAIEMVTGTLNGKTGTFALQHTGTMNRGKLSLSITVVPDSGTGQLVGLTGTMNINVVEGKHSYDFNYSLPEAQ